MNAIHARSQLRHWPTASEGRTLIVRRPAGHGQNVAWRVRARARVAIASAEGVPLVFGTDGGVLPHGQNAREFAAMVEVGVPPIEAIPAATTVAALALRRTDTLGTIAVGRAADIVAVHGDPLREVAALSRVSFVMRGGRVIRRP